MLVVRVTTCHTKRLFAMGLVRTGEVCVGAIVQKYFLLCFLLSCSVFPFVFVLLWTFECCCFVVVVFYCVFSCAGSAIFVCLLILLFVCGCVWAW